MASILVVVSQIMFYFLIKEVVSDGNILSIIIISVASGIGSYIAFYMNKKLSKDVVYIHIVTANDKSKMKSFGDYMRSEDIKIVTMNTYNDDKENTLTALVFANTKEQSWKIDKYIEANDGFFREVVD